MTPEVDEQALFVASCLDINAGKWHTASEYEQNGCAISPEGFSSATNVLLTQPNLNSSHLFRADILYDSKKQLRTPAEVERDHGLSPRTAQFHENVANKAPETFPGFVLTRTVVRKLIPRNAQLDGTLIQSCHIYEVCGSRHLVVYQPHSDSAEATPWYHPPVRALAYLYETKDPEKQDNNYASISIHVLPFEASLPNRVVPVRLHRTLLSLLYTMTRLSKNISHPHKDMSHTAIAPKDNIIPQHIVQDTYSRLKYTYSTDLIGRWVEKTEPSKHVFEDLSIAAFLIELWRQIYGVLPICERPTSATSRIFPGFVDIACGNGVLVYVLRNEGYEGWGFDARRRRTWEVLPGDMQQHLLEQVLVPDPFLRALLLSGAERSPDIGCHKKTESLIGLECHNGIFKAGTFIISNHADELTPWTPILAVISCPAAPLPWLAIPCCSHSLSGAKHRYPVSKPTSQPEKYEPTKNSEEEEQPANGDLKSLRAAKAKAASGADQSSKYACLTAKVIALAEELDIETERTLMRIPSTRNVGIIGGRRLAAQKLCSQIETGSREKNEGQAEELQNGVEVEELNGKLLACDFGNTASSSDTRQKDGKVVQSEHTLLNNFEGLIKRECRASGGVAAAAEMWMERTKSLQTGQGRGKLNAGKAHG